MHINFLHKHARKKIDLTNGCIWKTILVFSIPIFFSYVLQNIYSIADAAICGQTLSAYDVAGVNDTGSISFLFLQFAFGCTAGMSTLLSENIGKNDEQAIKKTFATQLRLSAIICVVLIAVGLLTLDPILSLIGISPSGAETNNMLYTAAKTYMTVIIGGMCAQYFYNFMFSTLRSLGDSFTPLIFLVISSVTNIALDCLFIMAFDWGVAGAAGATIASQVLSAALCFVFALKKYPVLRIKPADFKPDLKYDLKCLSQGIPLGLQFSILAFGLIALANGIVAFDKTPDGIIVTGAPAQNGFASANRVSNIMSLFPNALATAILPFISQNLGAKKYDRIKSGYIQTLIIMLIVSATCAAIGFLISINGAYQYVLLSSEKISAASIEYGRLFMLTHLPTLPALGILVISRNAVQGLEKPLFPLLSGIAELVVRIVICMFLPALINGGPIDCMASGGAYLALTAADPLAWLAADIILMPSTVYNIRKLIKKQNATVPDVAEQTLCDSGSESESTGSDTSETIDNDCEENSFAVNQIDRACGARDDQ